MKLPKGTKLPRACDQKVLIEAIEMFRKANDDYGTPDGAQYVCFEASAEFLGELCDITKSENVCTVREMFFCHDGRHTCDEPRNRLAHLFDDYPLITHVDQRDISNHVVVLVGNLCIDFTARQFKSDAPWPLIWIYKKPVTRRAKERTTGREVTK